MGPIFRAIREGGPPDEPAFNFVYLTISQSFNEAVNLGTLKKMVMYQLRHTGPSWERLQNSRSRDDCFRRSRWKTLQSFARYETMGEVSREYMRYSQTQRSFMESCSKEMQAVMLHKRLPLTPPRQRQRGGLICLTRRRDLLVTSVCRISLWILLTSRLHLCCWTCLQV